MLLSKKLVIYLFFIFVITSCIDPITLNQAGEVSVLVVEGGITTEFGPHTIKLTRSAQYGDVFVGEIKQELGAQLFIRDELGNTIRLFEHGNGVYSTSVDFRGEIGRKYTLIIITKDGKEYQSYPELLTKVPAIDSVFIEYVEVPIRTQNFKSFKYGVNVYVAYQDPSEVSNYYKWEISGTYRLPTHPELYVNPSSGAVEPKDCCELCYTTEGNLNIGISSDRFYNGNPYEKEVFFIEDDGRRFYEKYIIHIRQLSISKEAYEYYNLLKNQLSIQGNIFDPPPATIRGNIIGITNPDAPVVGYFSVADIKRIDTHIIGYTLPKSVIGVKIRDDCRESRNAIRTKPDYWDE